jgi:hypothetical protein
VEVNKKKSENSEEKIQQETGQFHQDPSIKSWPLRRVFVVVLICLCIPPSIALISSCARARSIRNRIDGINLIITNIDDVIASELTSPFYLSQVDPCSEETIRRITQKSINIKPRFTQGEDHLLCVWDYILKDDPSALLATDVWDVDVRPGKEYFYKLERSYYDNSHDRIIAADYYQLNEDCFRKRVYYDEAGNEYAETVCFSESGKALIGTTTAPIPPMLYWFFYR